MVNLNPKVASEFKRYLPTLRLNDRRALLVLCAIAFGLTLTLLRASTPPLQPLPDFVVKIDLNSADTELLMQLPRIGPVLASRIVDYRRANGPFQNIAQLQRVKGIGPVLLESLRPLIEVNL